MDHEEWADGWEPYDDRPELAAARARAAAGGLQARRPCWYDLDAATAASLMVLGALAVPAAAVGYAVARRFRVVRR